MINKIQAEKSSNISNSQSKMEEKNQTYIFLVDET